MKLFNKVLGEIEFNKREVESGKYNCILTPFPTLRKAVPGIRKGDHICITAHSGIGKSIFTKFYAILSPVLFNMANKNYNIKVIYFALEESKEYIMTHLMCNRLKYACGIEVTPDELLSYYEGYKVSDELIECIKSQKSFFEYLESKVTFIDDTTEVDQILNIVESYYSNRDENTHYIFVMDHISLLTGNESEHVCMAKYSRMFVTKYCKVGFTSIVVQQQAAAGENVENIKMNKGEPSKSNLGDNKKLGRDYNFILGIYSPYENKLGTYSLNGKTYNISEMKDSFIALLVLKNRRGRSKIGVGLQRDNQLNFIEI